MIEKSLQILEIATSMFLRLNQLAKLERMVQIKFTFS